MMQAVHPDPARTSESTDIGRLTPTFCQSLVVHKVELLKTLNLRVILSPIPNNVYLLHRMKFKMQAIGPNRGLTNRQ